MKHGMHFRILHFFPDIRTDNLDFRLGHSKVPGEESIGEAFEAFHDLEVVPGADFFLQISPRHKLGSCKHLITRLASLTWQD